MAKRNKRARNRVTALLISVIALLIFISAAWMLIIDHNSPEKTARDFYDWYIHYPRVMDKNGDMHDPIIDKAYRSSKYLTADMIRKVDSSIIKERPYDPFVLAESVPVRIKVDKAVVYGRNADVLVNEWFSGKVLPHSIHVDLKKTGNEWRIDDVSLSTIISY